MLINLNKKKIVREQSTTELFPLGYAAMIIKIIEKL